MKNDIFLKPYSNMTVEETIKSYGNYTEVDYYTHEFKRGQSVFVMVQHSECGHGYSYGYMKAVAQRSEIKPNFITEKEFYSGCQWTNTVYKPSSDKIYVDLELPKPIVKSKSREYSRQEKEELDNWYNNLSHGNRRACDLITSGRYDEI